MLDWDVPPLPRGRPRRAGPLCAGHTVFLSRKTVEKATKGKPARFSFGIFSTMGVTESLRCLLY